MSKLKASDPAGLMVLIAVGFLIIGSALIAEAIRVDAIVTIKKTLYVTTEIDDRGTKLTSLLNSNYDDRKYMEVFGATDEVPEEFLQLLETTGINHQLIIFRGSDDTIIVGAQPPDDSKESIMDIPLPGGEKGRVKAEVRLKQW